MKRDILKASFWSICGRVPGMAIPFVIAAYYGVSVVSDAFFLVYGILFFIQMILNNVLETAIVPYLAHLLSKNNKADVFLSAVMQQMTKLIIVLSVGTAVVFFLITSTASGSHEQMTVLGWRFLFELIPMLFLGSWASLLNGALNTIKKFSLPAASPAIRSVIIILSIMFLRDVLGIHALPVGFVTGELVRFLAILFLIKKDFRVSFPVAQTLESFHFVKTIKIQLIGFALFFFSPLLNQWIASYLEPGSISVFTYAERLRNIPFLIFTTGIVPVVLSHWASDRSRGQGAAEEKKHAKVMGNIFFLAAILALLGFVFREWVVNLALNRGDFPADRIGEVVGLLTFFLLSLPFDLLGVVLMRYFVLCGKDIYYVWGALARILCMACVAWILLKTHGVSALGLGWLSGNLIYALWLSVCLGVQKKGRGITTASERTQINEC